MDRFRGGTFADLSGEQKGNGPAKNQLRHVQRGIVALHRDQTRRASSPSTFPTPLDRARCTWGRRWPDCSPSSSPDTRSYVRTDTAAEAPEAAPPLAHQD